MRKFSGGKRIVLIVACFALFALSAGVLTTRWAAGRPSGFATYLPTVAGNTVVRQLGVHVSIWVWNDGVTIPQDLELAATTQATLVRLPLSWHLLQQYGPDSYVTWYETAIQELVATAQAHDFDILLMMGDPPAWAVDTNEAHCSEGRDPRCNVTDPADYAAAVQHVLELAAAASDGHTQLYFEVWNEPNFYWDPELGTDFEPMTAAEYTTLLQATYTQVKPYHPDILIVGGALAGSSADYLSAMYAAEAQGHYDVLSIHPYTEGNTLSPDDCDEPGVNLDWSYCQGVEYLHTTMLAHGDRSPLWFTEFGYSSAPPPSGVGEAQQSDYLARALTLIEERNWSYVGAAIWYNLRDCTDVDPVVCTSAPTGEEHYFGLFDLASTPKPVVSAFTLTQPSVTPTPTATPVPTPEPLMLTVSGDDATGETLEIVNGGMYRLTITDGVYSPWSSNNYPHDQWRSIVMLYRNRPIAWIEQPWGWQPGNADFEIGHWELTGETESEAESRAIGTTLDMTLSAGDELTFVVVDTQDSYPGNRGDVTFEISYLGAGLP